MLEALMSGILLGLASGMAPGPLTVLTISSTLRYSLREGLKVAITPLLTDAPLVALSLFLAVSLAGAKSLLGGISLAGGLFLLYLAWETLKIRGLNLPDDTSKPKTLRKAVLANLLSPHPYLFWFTVGASLVVKFSAAGWWAAAAFLAGFYFCLVGCKMLMAYVSKKARPLLMGRAYVFTMRVLGMALAVFSALLFKDGLSLLGVIK